MNLRPILKKTNPIGPVGTDTTIIAASLETLPKPLEPLPKPLETSPKPLKTLPKIAIRHAIYQETSKEPTKLITSEPTNTPKKPIILLRPRTISIPSGPTSVKVSEMSGSMAKIWSRTGSMIDRSALGPNQRIVASFDVGIKHLAYCVMSYSNDVQDLKKSKFNVFDWGIINLIEDSTESSCDHLMPKTGKLCGKKALYQAPQVRLCGIHAKRVEGAEPIPPGPKADSIPIQTLCTSMVKKLDEYPIFLQVDDVLIEQQPAFGSSRPFGNKFKGPGLGLGPGLGSGPGVHPRMKNLSYMIYSYFIMRGIVDPHLKEGNNIKSVKFISSTNKLKLYDGPVLNMTQKNTYQRNKFQAKEHLKYILREQPELLTFFELFKKKDDLADCFLQGAWYLKKGLNSS